MADHIVTRLRDLLDGPVPMIVERQHIRDVLDEIERLRQELGTIRNLLEQANYEMVPCTTNSPNAGRTNMAAEPSNRRWLLEHAASLVDGDRNNTYGDPIQDFRRIADYWNTYLTSLNGRPLKPHDVAVLMSLLKIARLSWSAGDGDAGPKHADSWVDLAGYAACGWDCVKRQDG